MAENEDAENPGALSAELRFPKKTAGFKPATSKSEVEGSTLVAAKWIVVDMASFASMSFRVGTAFFDVGSDGC